MSKVKQILFSLFGLLVAMIFLMVILRALKGVPVIGGLAADAQNLATSGTIA